MTSRLKTLLDKIVPSLRGLGSGPQSLAFFPAILLVAFWLGGEALLIIFALTLPLGLLCIGVFNGSDHVRRTNDPSDPTAVTPEVLTSTLDKHLKTARTKAQKTACLLMEIDDFEEIGSRFGHSVAQHVLNVTFDRVQMAIRSHDKVLLLNDTCLAVAVAPVQHFDLDVGLKLASRLQTATEEPVLLGTTTVYLSVSFGFCISSQLEPASGPTLVHAAKLALTDARRHSPSAIRAYSQDLRDLKTLPSIELDEVTHALESGQIQAWYQPQISTHTGEVTGFEALARWLHPERGIVPPSEFLPLLESGARLERLSEVILQHAMGALRKWDMQGHKIAHVGVNFSPEELRNPRLLSKIEWELDRFDLTPDRLVIEILETVVAGSPDDVVTRNINGLSAMGCHIDLDDFGTGHASISAIRRFAIGRLKIDRSYVMKVDRDPEQQRMVSAILLMAERLELDTLAEGVETAGEHSMLAQLGCGHVQGFGLARPMPLEKTSAWITEYSSKLGTTPEISRKFG